MAAPRLHDNVGVGNSSRPARISIKTRMSMQNFARNPPRISKNSYDRALVSQGITVYCIYTVDHSYLVSILCILILYINL